MKHLDPIYFAPQRKLGGGWICYKDSPSPPPAPDYTQAAIQTAQGNKEAAIAAQRGSMVDQYTPYGNQTYSQTGKDEFGNPTFRADINLSESGQKLLDQSDALSQGLFGAQNTQLNQINQQGPIQWNDKPLMSSQEGSDVAYKAATSRLDPQWQASSEAQENKLVNQGLQPGTEAYTNAMRDFNYAKNDAYGQARGQAEQVGLQQAAANNAQSGQQLQIDQTKYSQPLNQLNALRSGSQVTNPQFGAQPQQQYVGGPNYLGAQQAQSGYNQGLYNSQVGSANSANAGMMGLAGTAAMAFAV